MAASLILSALLLRPKALKRAIRLAHLPRSFRQDSRRCPQCVANPAPWRYFLRALWEGGYRADDLLQMRWDMTAKWGTGLC